MFPIIWYSVGDLGFLSETCESMGDKARCRECNMLGSVFFMLPLHVHHLGSLLEWIMWNNMLHMKAAHQHILAFLNACLSC